ncbi:MAG: ABC transporter permease [Gammaproteobacteria bacterium]
MSTGLVAACGQRVRPYAAIMGARLRVLLQYRAAAFAGFVTQAFWGAVKLMVLAAFLGAATATLPLSLPQVVAYVWLGQGLLGLLPWNVDGDIAGQVRSGAVAHELLRPVNLYAYWFARTLAFRLMPTALRLLPLIVFAGLLLPAIGLGAWALPPPAGIAAGLLFGISMLAAVVLSTGITMIMHISLFWTLSGEGFNRLMLGLVPVFSGMVIPLPLFPDSLQGLLWWQPFRGLVDVPYRIYGGHLFGTMAVLEIVVQWLWAAGVVLIGVLLLRRATRDLVVQGG